MFIFEKNPKNLQKPVEYTRFDGIIVGKKNMEHCPILQIDSHPHFYPKKKWKINLREKNQRKVQSNKQKLK